MSAPPARAVHAPDISAAAERLAGAAVETPLLEFPELSELAGQGRRVWIKFEGAQVTGSFKFRGAFHTLSRLPHGSRVVAFSSGNHAQGVAAAAHRLGLKAKIVMPADAPQVKVDRTLAWGAEVIPYDRLTQSREDIARSLLGEDGVLVPSFDHPDVIAGQGTVGREIVRQVAARTGEDPAAALSAVLVPCSGGGLVAGIATAVKDQVPEASVYTVEPEGYDDHARSLAIGSRVSNPPLDSTGLCDALLAPQPGELTWPINSHLLKGGLVVTDAEVRKAVRYAFHTLKLVVEPGGAVGLAALLAGKFAFSAEDRKGLVLVLSGANVDPRLFAEIITESN